MLHCRYALWMLHVSAHLTSQARADDHMLTGQRLCSLHGVTTATAAVV